MTVLWAILVALILVSPRFWRALAALFVIGWVLR